LRGASEHSDGLRAVGDCILLDFVKGFFAVSDSSDRNPSFSRDFMIRFAGMLEGIPDIQSGKTCSDAEQAAIREKLEYQSELILGEMSFSRSCTFTGVLILKTETGYQGLLLHTGDSLLLQCDLDTGTVRQLTQNNFWMVGRTSRFFQIETISLSKQTRLLLATDGFSCLKTPGPGRREDFVRQLFETHPVEKIVDILMDGYDAHGIARDDLAMVSLHPERIHPLDQRIILGGTTNHLERLFQEGKTTADDDDLYLPMVRGIGRAGTDFF
jgi:hypothetical protein